MRLLSLAFAVIVFATVAQAEEILVFADGARIVVDSYEVRGNVVVFTTLDGKLRSVPLSYIDVAAMKVPNTVGSNGESAAPVAQVEAPELPPATPVARQAPLPETRGSTDDRLEKIKRILELYGTETTLRQFRRRVETQVVELGVALPHENHQQLLGALKQGFASSEVIDIVARTFADGSTEKQLDSWLGWLECPLARRMIEMEQTAHADGDERSRFAKKIERRPVPESRLALVGRLDDLVATSATDVEMHLTIAEVLQDSYRSLTDTPAEDGIAILQDQVEKQLKNENMTNLLFAYRLLDADELWGYLSYWETQPGQRLAELMKESLVAGARVAGESTARALGQRVAASN
jgi:hypothetical protein